MFINRVVYHLLTRTSQHPFSSQIQKQMFTTFKKRQNNEDRHTSQPRPSRSESSFFKSAPKNNRKDQPEPLPPSEVDVIQHSALGQSLRDCFAGKNQSLHLLFSFKEQVFKVQPKLIPLFLSAVTPHLNQQNYNTYKQDFDFINLQLNNYSQQLSMSPQCTSINYEECLTMLHYRVTCKQYESKYSFTANFGFQRKSTIVCASLIHKKELDLNQTIYTLESLLKLGSASVLLFMNFVKYIKSVFLQKKTKISLIQLLTILNSNLLKRNQITLQNILYDQVLNHLLNNLPSYLKEESFMMKVEVLNILLSLEGKKFYKSNGLTKQLWIVKLIREIQEQVGNGWAEELCCLERGNEPSQVNWLHVLSIVQSISFVKENKLEDQCFEQQFNSFLQKINGQLSKAIKEILGNPKSLKLFKSKQQNQQYLIRLLFNPEIMKRWLSNIESTDLVQKIIKKITLTKEEAYFPLIDAFNKCKSDPQLRVKLLKIVRQAYKTAKKSDLIVWGLVAQQMQFLPPSKIKKNIEELQQSQLSPKDSLSYWILVDYYSRTLKLPHDKSDHQTHLFDTDPKASIETLYTVIHSFRNIHISKGYLTTLIQTCEPLRNYIYSIKEKQYAGVQNDQLFFLLFLYICSAETNKVAPEILEIWDNLQKSQILKHQFLIYSYPNDFPHPKKYYQRVNILTQPTTFKKYFQSIYEFFSEPKYTYFLWDLFLKNFTQLPLETRKDCFGLLQNVFMEAFEKENLRKIILLMVLTNYISSGVIVAPKHQLRKLFQTCIDQLVKAQEIIEFHYQCYLQIVVNAIAADILSMDYFHKIIKHSLDKSPQLKLTTTLMLLYGASMIHFKSDCQTPKNKEMIENQIRYLKYLIRNKRFKFKYLDSLNQIEKEDQPEAKESSEYAITAKIIAIYLRAQMPQILGMKDIIFPYLESTNDFKEWILVAYCFTPDQFSLTNSEEREFRTKLTEMIRIKMKNFKEKGLLSQQHEIAITERLKLK